MFRWFRTILIGEWEGDGVLLFRDKNVTFRELSFAEDGLRWVWESRRMCCLIVFIWLFIADISLSSQSILKQSKKNFITYDVLKNCLVNDMWEPLDMNVKTLLKYHTHMTLCFMLIKIMLSKKKLSVLSHILSVHISILLKRRPEAWFSYMKNVAIVKPKLSIEILDFVCIDNRIHEVHRGEEEKNYLLSRHCQ